MSNHKANMPISEQLAYFIRTSGFKTLGGINKKIKDRTIVTHIDSGIIIIIDAGDSVSSIINRLVRMASLPDMSAKVKLTKQPKVIKC